MKAKLDELIRTTKGEVTTVRQLEKQGRITYQYVPNFYAPRSEKGTREVYFANIDNGESGSVEISKLAYFSRTGQTIDESMFWKQSNPMVIP